MVLDDLWVGLGDGVMASHGGCFWVVLRFWWWSLGCLGDGVGGGMSWGLDVHNSHMKSNYILIFVCLSVIKNPDLDQILLDRSPAYVTSPDFRLNYFFLR